ncbi:reverse transcriptase domain-containing protein [Tanacetum coccineum]
MPRECLKIIESKSKVHQSQSKAIVSKVSTNFSTPAVSSDVAELKDMVRALILDKKNQTPTPAPVKAVEQSCVTCGGGHSYQNCPATDGNIYRDNIQEYVSQAAAVNYNQGNASYRPQMVANQIRPPGQVYQPQINQPPTFQAPPYQAPAPAPPAPGNTFANPKGVVKAINYSKRCFYNGPQISSPPKEKENEPRCGTISTPTDIAEDVFVKVGTFFFPADFVVVDYIADPRVPLILGRPFLRMARALIDVHGEQMTLRHDDQSVTFKVGDTKTFSYNIIETVNRVDVIDIACEEYVREIKSSCEDPPDLELKRITPSHLGFLKSYKHAIAWKISDIKGIDLQFCTHKILMEENAKPVVQHQRRVNPKIHEVIKQEAIKLLDAGLIYPISNSPWVSPVHCVPKKGGITVVKNEENELIPTRLVTGWRVCIDYRKLNDATRKDHFPLPFMDQILERLAGNEYYCFLDGFSGYFQIPIDPLDQEKTTFTCPYGTFAYRRMPFGLCNAPGTFQRCMVAIFHDMIGKTMEVFMDDFSVFGDSFSSCLSHLDKMLQRCEDTNLVLNWEMFPLWSQGRIVLGHYDF